MIFLHHISIPALSFLMFNLKEGKMGGPTSLKNPKLQNGQFSRERADVLCPGIFLHHIDI